jgi:hypothetical protein
MRTLYESDLLGEVLVEEDVSSVELEDDED